MVNGSRAPRRPGAADKMQHYLDTYRVISSSTRPCIVLPSRAALDFRSRRMDSGTFRRMMAVNLSDILILLENFVIFRFVNDINRSGVPVIHREYPPDFPSRSPSSGRLFVVTKEAPTKSTILFLDAVSLPVAINLVFRPSVLMAKCLCRCNQFHFFYLHWLLVLIVRYIFAIKMSRVFLNYFQLFLQ